MRIRTFARSLARLVDTQPAYDRGASTLWFKYYRRKVETRRQQNERNKARQNVWDLHDLGDYLENTSLWRDMSHERLFELLNKVSELWKKNKQDEVKFFASISDLNQRMDDAQLGVLSRRMREMLGFKDLIQISNTVVESVIVHVESQLVAKAEGRDGRLMVLNLIREAAKVRKANNDVAEGINQPTLDKLQQFNREYHSGQRSPTPLQNDPSRVRSPSQGSLSPNKSSGPISRLFKNLFD
jgi:hypothetical protein